MTGPRAVFIGPMGSGKTKVGKRVAKALGVSFLDTDKMVVAEHGPIADIFDTHGEAHFRALERAAVREAFASDGIVSLGGGAILDPETQADLAALRVVYLSITAEAVESRLDNGKRPLVRGGIAHLRGAPPHLRRPRDGRDRHIARALRRRRRRGDRLAGESMNDVTVIPVSGTDGMKDYAVHVGRGLVTDIASHLPPKAEKVLIVHAPAMGARAEAMRAKLSETHQVFLAEVPDAEGAKRVEVAAFC